MVFTETFSLYLLHDLPWQEGEKDIRDMFEKQWALLREGVLYFTRFEEGQHTSERILAAQKALVDNGKIAEEVRCIGLQAVFDRWTRRLNCAADLRILHVHLFWFLSFGCCMRLTLKLYRWAAANCGGCDADLC